MTLATEFERVTLDLARPFGISRGTVSETETVIVRVRDGSGRVGLGAAAPSAHYGETAATVEAVLPDLLAVVEDVGDPARRERIQQGMQAVVRDNPAARAAVSIAVHDLAAKRLDVPLYELWGLDPGGAPQTSFTVGLADTATMREAAADAVSRGHDVLKVKLGTDRDREVLAAVRDAAPDATLRVDANEAWTPREAVGKTAWLANHGVQFVEQPVPAEHPDGMRFVREHGHLPVAADESCVALADVPQVAEIADVAVLKLMKCGGLREAREMVAACRAHGLEIMLGCMVESAASIAAAANLAPLVDYADLDGALLLADGTDPVSGVPMPGGDIDLSGVGRGTGAVEHGTGAVER